MTTTPGPRTAWLRTVIVEHATSFQGEADAVALVAEFEDRIRAEARADVDGLVARLREAEEALDRIASGHPLDDGTELREWVEWAQTDADAALDWNRRKAEAPE